MSRGSCSIFDVGSSEKKVDFFRGGLCNGIKVNGRFELKLRVSNDHCLMFVEERRWCEWFKKVLVSNYFPMIAHLISRWFFLCQLARGKKMFRKLFSCQIKWIYWTIFDVTVFKLHPNCFHMHKKLCSKIIAPHRY